MISSLFPQQQDMNMFVMSEMKIPCLTYIGEKWTKQGLKVDPKTGPELYKEGLELS